MPTRTISTTRTLAIIFLASAVWAFTFGLAAPLMSLWLRDRGCCDSVIGLNTGVHFLGIVVTAPLVPWLMRRGGRRCVVAGMLAAGLATALFPWSDSLSAWFALRFLEGVGGALSLIPLETLVNRVSPPAHRARNFGYYIFAMALGLALGNLVGLQLYEHHPFLAFALGGSASIVALAVVQSWLPWPAEPEEETQRLHPLSWRKHFLSFGSAWSQGFLEGSLVAFLAIYLLYLGLPEERVSYLTSAIMVGVILVQLPVAWLADRIGRTTTLMGCYVIAALSLALLPFCADSAWLACGLFLVGACSSAFYPLGLALLGEQLAEADLAQANAWYLAINCFGCLVGPIAAGFAMDCLGKPALFLVGEIAVVLVLGCWQLVRRHTSTGQSSVLPCANAMPHVEIHDAA